MRLYSSLLSILLYVSCAVSAQERPNVILVMADDLGWGDTGYNGHPLVQTPHLDAMAANGLRFDRFYAASAVCSPTRGSCLTGRHPFRYGINGANTGHLPQDEFTIAEGLKTAGYATGFFGKWHLGTLTTTEKDSNRGGRTEHAGDYSPPWEHGFDVTFSTEAKVPTYDPMVTPAGWGNGQNAGQPFGTYYWTGPGEKVTENLEGDDSRVIMDRAIPFIRDAAESGTPFFAVVWFHAPHLPVVAGPEHRALYPDLDDEGQHYFGCITALDEQVGRLRATLRELGVAENTMLWFCSDNGPEGRRKTPNNGSAGSFRGRKRALYEGGVRVPGLLEWPARVEAGRVTDAPCVTSDYLPTIFDVVGLERHTDLELDGVSLTRIIDGDESSRSRPIGFALNDRRTYNGARYKIRTQGADIELYDLAEDVEETKDISGKHRDIVYEMVVELRAWEASLDE